VVAIVLRPQGSGPLANLEFFLDRQVRAGAGAGLGHQEKARAKASPQAPKNT